jgi:hypothetical protein
MGKSLYEFLDNEVVDAVIEKREKYDAFWESDDWMDADTSIDGRLTCKNAELYLSGTSDGLDYGELHIEIDGGAVEFEVDYENGVITNVTMWNWN